MVASDQLSQIGLRRGSWLILEPAAGREFDDSERSVLVARVSGSFRATGEAWTVAKAERISDGGSARIQLSYKRPEKQFRPERLAAAELRILGTVVDVAEEV